ncbi:ribonuclease P protein component [uncultured Amnibacterium sp.]|uniref:ribonuclease P protein component n=1 Tax=uncultured Amnibacterium sp. TaxID=1631851 RepID=UPI0035C9AF41
MLAKANRVTAAVDYRRITRTGRRQRGEFVLAYGRWSEPEQPLRMGVIVARNVGNAVVRNRVRRRIKAVGWSLASGRDGASGSDGASGIDRAPGFTGLDVVIRALPGSALASWPALQAEVREAVRMLAASRPAGAVR